VLELHSQNKLSFSLQAFLQDCKLPSQDLLTRNTKHKLYFKFTWHRYILYALLSSWEE